MKRPRDDLEEGLEEEVVVSSEGEMDDTVAKDTRRSSTWLGHCPTTPGPARTALLKALQEKALDKARAPDTIPKAIPAKAMPIIKGSAPMVKGKASPKMDSGCWGLPHLIRPGSQGQVVYVWPTGFRVLDDVHRQFLAHQRGGGHGRFMPSKDDVLAGVKAIMDPYEADMLDKCHIVTVDARGPPLAKPSPKDMLHGHCGTHPDILTQMLTHYELKTVIGDELRAQWPKGRAAEEADIG